MTCGVEWPDDRVQHMIHLLAKGLPQQQIANRVGVTIGALWNKLSKLRAAGDPRLPERLRKADPKKQRTRAPKQPAQRVASPITAAHGPTVRRDPCFRCGVRRDIGCEHTAWEKAA